MADMKSNYLRSFCLVSGGFAGATGLAVLAGWVFDIAALKSVLPGFVAMQPWTASGVVLGGAALVLAVSGALAARITSAALAVMLFIAGGLPILEYLTDCTFGTDMWLLPRAVQLAQTHPYPDPGRMSEASAAGLTTVAIALLLAPQVQNRAGRVTFSTLATVGLVMALLVLIRYVLGLEALDILVLRNPLAIHSALALAVLSAGTLALRPDVGWVRVVAEHGVAGWVAAGLLGLAGTCLVFGAEAAMQPGANKQVSAQATVQIEALLSALKDAETGERGFLLTGRTLYLEPFETARNSLPPAFAKVIATRVNTNVVPNAIDHLEGLVTAEMAELSDTIALQRDGRHDEAMALVETDRGIGTMDLIRRDIMLRERSVAEWEAARSGHAWRVAAAAAVGITLLVVLGIWALIAVARGQRKARSALFESEVRQRDMLAALGLGTFMARDPEGTICYWAEGCTRLYGWTAKEAIGQAAYTLLAADEPVPRAEIEAALTRTGSWTGDLRHRTRDGRVLLVTAHKMMRRGANGKPDLVLESLIDVTAQRCAEADLRDSQALLRTIIETAPGLIYAKDRQGRMLLANSAVAAATSKPFADLTGLTDREFLADPRQGEAVMANDRRIMENGRPEEIEESVDDPSGRTLVWLSTKAPMRNADGTVTGLVGVSLDITHRKAMEEQLRHVVNELNHRVKNTLATVQSIAAQTLRGVASAARETLEGRLEALALVHDVVTREGWREADLREVIEAVLAPYGGSAGGRFAVFGPAVRLVPRVAVALSMALHELATNAVKFGALSCDTGAVSVRWRITADEEPRLEMRWSERGGPAVTEPATRGFGTRLIERGLAFGTCGRTRILFEAGGVVCVVDALLKQVSAPAQVVAFPRVGRAAMGG